VAESGAGKIREIGEMSAWYLHQLRKDAMARYSKEEMLAPLEAGKALTSLSKSRGATTLRELVREVTTMTKVSKVQTILAIDSCWWRRLS